MRQIDREEDSGIPGCADLKKRYELEEELEKIFHDEELMWQKRSREQWLLKGDANTGYFHSIANGGKRKCRIEYLEEGDRIITEHKDLKKHIKT